MFNSRVVKALNEMKTSIESSKWLVGAAAILVPLLSKTERLKLDLFQRQVLENEYVDLLFIFMVVFSGTRDLLISLVVTFVFHFLLNHVFSLGKPLSVLPESAAPPTDGKVTNKQIGDALDILERAYHERQGAVRAPWLL